MIFIQSKKSVVC